MNKYGEGTHEIINTDTLMDVEIITEKRAKVSIRRQLDSVGIFVDDRRGALIEYRNGHLVLFVWAGEEEPEKYDLGDPRFIGQPVAVLQDITYGMLHQNRKLLSIMGHQMLPEDQNPVVIPAGEVGTAEEYWEGEYRVYFDTEYKYGGLTNDKFWIARQFLDFGEDEE